MKHSYNTYIYTLCVRIGLNALTALINLGMSGGKQLSSRRSSSQLLRLSYTHIFFHMGNISKWRQCISLKQLTFSYPSLSPHCCWYWPLTVPNLCLRPLYLVLPISLRPLLEFLICFFLGLHGSSKTISHPMNDLLWRVLRGLVHYILQSHTDLLLPFSSN